MKNNHRKTTARGVPATKRRYVPPSIIEYGDLRAITLGDGGKKADGAGPKSKGQPGD